MSISSKYISYNSFCYVRGKKKKQFAIDLCVCAPLSLREHSLLPVLSRSNLSPVCFLLWDLSVHLHLQANSFVCLFPPKWTPSLSAVEKQYSCLLKISLFVTDSRQHTIESPGCPQIPLHSSWVMLTICIWS